MSASHRSTTIEDVVERLRVDFGERPEAAVREVVAAEYDALLATGVHIYLYIPNLVEHEARERLTALRPPHTP